MMKVTESRKTSFNQPMWPAVLIGTSVTGLFYALMLAGPLDFEMLRRYCLSHAVAIAAVGLFACAMFVLVQKALIASQQKKRSRASQLSLQDMLRQTPGDEQTDRVEWLRTMWSAQSVPLRHSWLGLRVVELLDRQSQRDNSDSLDDDIRDLAIQDADRQHESYGFVRIVIWAMPMLGFLGTVLGISKTLGKMDTKSLASGSQEAMDQLTAGLYVAFDTTAVGLVLTVVAMFLQFVVAKTELDVLGRIDSTVTGKLTSVLNRPSKPAGSSEALELVRGLADRLNETIGSVVERQAELWRSTLEDSHARWNALTSTTGDEIRVALRDELAHHVEQLDRVGREGAEQIDSRWHQWQTTMSEQARQMQSHQKDVARQTDLLAQLVQRGDEFERLDETMQRSLERFTDVDKFHDVAVCMTEAVAMLGTQLERRGMIGRQQIRRSEPDVIPFSTSDAPSKSDLGRAA